MPSHACCVIIARHDQADQPPLGGQPRGAQADFDAIRGDLDALDKKLDDARLFGEEQFVP